MAATLALCSCHLSVVHVYKRHRPVPASATPAPPAPAPPLPPAPVPAPTLTVAATSQGQPLPGATVTLRRVQDLAEVATGLTTDDAGQVTLPLGDGLTPGAIVLVTVTADEQTLSALAPIATPTQTGDTRDQRVVVDVATSLVARRFTSKVAEVVRAAPPAVDDGQRLAPLLTTLSDLTAAVRLEVAGPQRDARVMAAVAGAVTAPTVAKLDDLATAMIRFSGLKTAFVAAVEHCNDLTVAGMRAGGPVVVPALWQMADVVVPPPQPVVADGLTLRLVWQGITTLIGATDAAAALNAATAATVATPTNATYAAVNSTYVAPPITGGGGGPRGIAAGGPGVAGPTKVLFVSNRTGNNDIFVVDIDGTNTVNLTANAANDQTPEWSPDGSKIVFVSNRSGFNEIYTINADGTNLTNLTNTGVGSNSIPVWSPDGTKLVFASTRAGGPQADLYVMNADGTGVVRLTTDPTVQNHSYVWAPDSARIAFSSTRAGNNECYVMNADGTGVVRLTTDPANDFVASWSPDGNRVGFLSNRNGNYRIYTVKPDGTGLLTLTPDAAFNWLVNWSPDSAKITYRTDRDGNTEIYSMNADGSNQTNLTNNAATDDITLHTWSRDGSKILFISSRDGNQEVYVMNADGTAPTNLTHNAAADNSPRFKP